MDLALTFGVLSLAISVLLAIVLFRVLRRDRESTQVAESHTSPTLAEAERLSEAIGPLLLTVRDLNTVVVDGRAKYEARIAQLQAELDKATGKSN